MPTPDAYRRDAIARGLAIARRMGPLTYTTTAPDGTAPNYSSGSSGTNTTSVSYTADAWVS